MRGANFQAVHELLDVVVDHAQDYADTAAERVVALGLPIDARIATVAAKTTTPALKEGFQQSDATIAQVIAGDRRDAQERAHRDRRARRASTPPSQDVVIEIARGLEKDRWFLFAHIATK